jgi:membrane protein required for colicin V production
MRRSARSSSANSSTASRASAMNAFDVVVAAAAVVAIVLGFSTGLLRSLATILGYLVAAPLAVAITPYVTTIALGRSMSPDNAWLMLVIVFVAAGAGISALLRIAVGEFVGPDVGAFDRVAGAALGAVRIGLIAVLIVVVFDRVISRRPPTAIPRRIEAASVSVGRRPSRLAVLAARGRELHRSGQTRARFVTGRSMLTACSAVPSIRAFTPVFDRLGRCAPSRTLHF